MSLHPSLRKAGGKTRTLRNVLKRHERLRYLMSRGRWTDGQSAFGLPKIKQEKVKVKKAAPKEKEAAATPAAEAPAAKASPAS